MDHPRSVGFLDWYAVKLQLVALETITELLCDLFLQGLDLRVAELDHLAGVEVDQMVVVLPVRILVSSTAITKFQPVQNPRFFKQLHRAVDRRQRNTVIDGIGAGVQLLHIRVIKALLQHLGDGPARAGHAQTMGLAAGNDRIGHACLVPVGHSGGTLLGASF